MAATGYTPISLYYSTTATQVPVNTNLVNGELAINITDGKLYYKDNSGVVKLLASNAASSPVTSFQTSLTGLTPNTSTTGAITLAGTLGVASGGTGLTTLTAGYVPFGNGTSAFGSSANLFWDNSNTRLGVGTNAPAVTFAVSSVDAMLVPVGTTGQRPTGATGYFRFNTSTAQFEGYNGAAWGTIGGGAALSNDTSTATALYPLFAAATSGNPSTIYTSNAKLLYTPSTGELQSGELYANNGVLTHANQVTSSYTVPTNANVITVTPWTVASGATFTLPAGSVQVLL
jgi:hypothetical protein